ncbi:hypothetical protein GY14_13380 [Delftia tsuruhatensis]|nr:hypothetical protein GY14_13380 [Delftia tsuruhatensis]
MVAQGLRPFHAHEAGAHIAFAHIEGRALAAGLRERAQRGLQHVLHIEARLVARTQPASGRAQAPVPIVPLHHEARLRQRARQPQHRGLVQRAAPAQFRQGQVRLPEGEGAKQLQGTRDGDDAAVLGRAGLVIGWLRRGRGAGGLVHGARHAIGCAV